MSKEMLPGETTVLTEIGGRGLGELAESIGNYPFPDEIRFGEVFNGNREIVKGFSQELLVKGLRRWDEKLNGADDTILESYKHRLELAAIEARLEMLRNLDPKLESKARERVAELRQEVERERKIELGSLLPSKTTKIELKPKEVQKLTTREKLLNGATIIKNRAEETIEKLKPFSGLDSFKVASEKISKSYRLGGDFFEQREMQRRSVNDESLLQVATWLQTNSLRKGQLNERIGRVSVFGKSGGVVEFDPRFTKLPRNSNEPVVMSEAVYGLAEMRAKLQVILGNVPDAYAGLQLGVKRTMKLVDNATLNLVDGKLGLSGRFSVEQVLKASVDRQTRGVREKAVEGALVLALAACGYNPGAIGTVTPEGQPIPTRTEQVMTRAPIENAEIDSAIANLTSLTTPTPEQSAELTSLIDKRKEFEQQANALPGWAEVKPENMEFAVVNIYDAGGSVAGGFLMVKNLETSEQMVLSVVERFEADGTAVRKEVNSPLYERFSIDGEGRLVNGDWYYEDAEGNEHSLYKTNAEGKLGGVPIEGEIIWSETVFRVESGSEMSLAKLAKLALPPGDLTGLTVDTKLGQTTDMEGNIIFAKKDGEWKRIVQVPQEISSQLPEGVTVIGGYLVDQAGVEMGGIVQGSEPDSYEITFVTADITGKETEHTINLNTIRIHPKGAIISDSGERTGFVWKGDKWAEILLQVQFETDGTKFDKFPTVTYEDIVSGALAEAERLATLEMSELMEPLNNYGLSASYGFIGPSFDAMRGYEAFQQLEKFPMRYKYFYKTVINDVPVIMTTLQVKNKNNIPIYIHMVESKNIIDSDSAYWLGIISLEVRYPSFDLALGGNSYDHCANGWSAAAKAVCAENNSNKQVLEKLKQEWIEDQSIPDQMESVFFVLSGGKWY